MATKFNPFLVKYLLSEDLPAQIDKDPSVTAVRFEATSNVEDPQKFFANISATDLEQYAKFAEEVIRIEVQYNSGVDVYYMFFRNGRQDRPDLGTGRYTFARPSSIELGYVDSGSYKSLYKKHYGDWIKTQDLTTTTDGEMRLLTKTIEYDIINTLIGVINQDRALQIPLKPVDANGMAIVTTKAQATPITTSAASPVNPVVEQLEKTI